MSDDGGLYDRKVRMEATAHAMSALRWFEPVLPTYNAPWRAVAALCAYCNGASDLASATRFRPELVTTRARLESLMIDFALSRGAIAAACAALDALLACLDEALPDVALVYNLRLQAEEAMRGVGFLLDGDK